jgi:hypothetical protein
VLLPLLLLLRHHPVATYVLIAPCIVFVYISMAKQKGSSSSKKPKHSNDANRSNAKGGKGQRDAATVSEAALQLSAWFLQPLLTRLRGCVLQVRRLKMYNTRAKRDKQGHILHEVSEVADGFLITVQQICV